MSGKPKLKQLDQSGASDGQVAAWNNTAGEWEPTSIAGATPHRPRDELVHLIAEDSFDEFLYSGNKVTDIITWTDSGKTTKIREEIYTYSGNQVSTIVTKQYDGAGVVIVGETMTETYAYTGNKVASITRVMT